MTIAQRGLGTYVTIAFLVILAVLRLMWLDADPPQFLPSSVVGDEGYWVHNARLHALFGRTFTDDFVEDAMVAPLLSLLLRASFELFGVGSVILLYTFMRQAGFRIALAASLLLSSNFLFFSINRLVMGESVSLFFFLLSLWFFGRRRGLASGFYFAMSVLSKSNTILLAPVFAFVVLADTWRFVRTFTAHIGFTIVVLLVSIALLGLMTHHPISDTYTLLSGTDYLPTSGKEIILNMKSFIKNPFWRRDGMWMIVIASLVQILRRPERSLPYFAGVGLIVSQIAAIAPFSNQGADHRFISLLLGFIIVSSFQSHRVLLITIGVVFLLNLLTIGRYFSALSFTLRDESRDLSTITDGGKGITGFFSHELVMENALYPVYWAPGHEKFYRINENIDRLRPTYLVVPTVVDGRDGTVFSSQEQRELGTNQEFVRHIRVLQKAGIWQFEADLYRIHW